MPMMWEHVAEPKLKQEVPKVGNNVRGENGDGELSTLVPGSL